MGILLISLNAVWPIAQYCTYQYQCHVFPLEEPTGSTSLEPTEWALDQTKYCNWFFSWTSIRLSSQHHPFWAHGPLSNVDCKALRWRSNATWLLQKDARILEGDRFHITIWLYEIISPRGCWRDWLGTWAWNSQKSLRWGTTQNKSKWNSRATPFSLYVFHQRSKQNVQCDETLQDVIHGADSGASSNKLKWGIGEFIWSNTQSIANFIRI